MQGYLSLAGSSIYWQHARLSVIVWIFHLLTTCKAICHCLDLPSTDNMQGYLSLSGSYIYWLHARLSVIVWIFHLLTTCKAICHCLDLPSTDNMQGYLSLSGSSIYWQHARLSVINCLDLPSTDNMQGYLSLYGSSIYWQHARLSVINWLDLPSTDNMQGYLSLSGSSIYWQHARLSVIVWIFYLLTTCKAICHCLDLPSIDNMQGYLSLSGSSIYWQHARLSVIVWIFHLLTTCKAICHCLDPLLLYISIVNSLLSVSTVTHYFKLSWITYPSIIVLVNIFMGQCQCFMCSFSPLPCRHTSVSLLYRLYGLVLHQLHWLCALTMCTIRPNTYSAHHWTNSVDKCTNFFAQVNCNDCVHYCTKSLHRHWGPLQ